MIDKHMQIVFFTHPAFQSHQSMPRYARWLANGMEKRGHQVTLWTAQPKVSTLPFPKKLKKWLEYADLFLLFPRWVKKKIRQYSDDTLFVFTDHALGPWIPLVSHRRHIIHCHDFMAQKSALGQIPGQHLSWTGKRYQAFIRKGYMQGKNFICVSDKTRQDLLQFLAEPPRFLEVVYNGVNPLYTTVDKKLAISHLSQKTGLTLSKGYLLHVGGNQWYKNRSGVIYIYNAWRQQYQTSIPLIMAGEKPAAELAEVANQSPYQKDIFFFPDFTDNEILYAYNTATVFLFPSLDEGFGWPIAESQACGCPVITTGAPPMNEVGGNAATYIDKMPDDVNNREAWAQTAAAVLQQLINLPQAERETYCRKGLENIKRFNSEEQLNRIAEIYNHL